MEVVNIRIRFRKYKTNVVLDFDRNVDPLGINVMKAVLMLLMEALPA